MSEKPPKFSVQSQEAQKNLLPDSKAGEVYSIATRRPYSKKEIATMEASLSRVEPKNAEGLSEKKYEKLQAAHASTMSRVENQNRVRTGMLPEDFSRKDPKEQVKDVAVLGLLGLDDEQLKQQQENQQRVNAIYTQEEEKAKGFSKEVKRIESEELRPRTHENIDLIRVGLKKKSPLQDLESTFASKQKELKNSIEERDNANETSYSKKIDTSSAQKDVEKKLKKASINQIYCERKRQVYRETSGFSRVKATPGFAFDRAFGSGFEERQSQRDLKRSLNSERIDGSDINPVLKNTGKFMNEVLWYGGQIPMAAVGLGAAAGIFVGNITLGLVDGLLNFGAKHAQKMMPKFMANWFYGQRKKTNIRGGNSK